MTEMNLGEMTMDLSAPTQPVFLVAVIVGALAILGGFVAIPFVTANASWLLIAAFVLLVLGNLLRNL
jgi:hypothetical protein